MSDYPRHIRVDGITIEVVNAEDEARWRATPINDREPDPEPEPAPKPVPEPEPKPEMPVVPPPIVETPTKTHKKRSRKKYA
jgi:hypothetical protein